MEKEYKNEDKNKDKIKKSDNNSLKCDCYKPRFQREERKECIDCNVKITSEINKCAECGNHLCENHHNLTKDKCHNCIYKDLKYFVP